MEGVDDNNATSPSPTPQSAAVHGAGQQRAGVEANHAQLVGRKSIDGETLPAFGMAERPGWGLMQPLQ